MKIPIKECKEPLVNVRDYNEEVLIDMEAESKQSQKLRRDTCYVRETVGLMLSQAQSLLPKGIKIKIIDGFRPIEAQEKIFAQVYSQIKKRNSQKTEKEILKETEKMVANPKTVPPHTTGGAVDVTLVKGKKDMKMGTRINALTPKAATDDQAISREAQNNRKLLKKVMKKVGFVNYPLEWWHFSYGDRMWACYKRKKQALYGSVKGK